MAFCQSIVKDWALTLNLLVLSNLASLKQSNKNCMLNCQMSEMTKSSLYPKQSFNPNEEYA